ncbi:Ras-related protein Rab [Acrasis kona]|uniref:Ras-related protein Rab-21 n=1 Tax=Acrasis kona TaxID=1008807 RepID=A0AAW2Z9C1_9EUKA
MSRHNFKIVLLGEVTKGRVGKTSLTLRFVKNSFDDHQQSTIQATYLQKELRIGDKTVTISVWDTAGQERFHALGPIYYRNADGALLVYDVTDHDTFIRAKNWVKELRKVVGDDITITIAGNKSDMKNRQVSDEEVAEYAKSVGAVHLHTSAKANRNVDEAFLDLTKRILEKKSSAPSRTELLGKQNSGIIIDNTERRVTRTESRMYGKNGGISVADEPKTTQEQKQCCG